MDSQIFATSPMLGRQSSCLFTSELIASLAPEGQKIRLQKKDFNTSSEGLENPTAMPSIPVSVKLIVSDSWD